MDIADPSVANPNTHTIGDTGIAVAAQSMFSKLKQAQVKQPNTDIGQGLSEPGTSHGKN